MTEKPAKPAEPNGPPLVPRTPRAIALFVVAALGLTALDLGSKSWAEDALSRPRSGEPPPVCEPGEDGWSEYQRLRGESVVLIDDVLELEYAENCGAAFSLLHSAPHPLRRAIFSLAALAACIALTVMFAQGRGGPFFAVGAPLVVSGALGNLVDRLRYGWVVDFIHFHWHDVFDYPVFNVADIGVVVGVILLLIDGARTPEPGKAPGAEPAPSDGKKAATAKATAGKAGKAAKADEKAAAPAKAETSAEDADDGTDAEDDADEKAAAPAKAETSAEDADDDAGTDAEDAEDDADDDAGTDAEDDANDAAAEPAEPAPKGAEPR